MSVTVRGKTFFTVNFKHLEQINKAYLPAKFKEYGTHDWEVN